MLRDRVPVPLLVGRTNLGQLTNSEREPVEVVRGQGLRLQTLRPKGVRGLGLFLQPCDKQVALTNPALKWKWESALRVGTARSSTDNSYSLGTGDSAS